MQRLLPGTVIGANIDSIGVSNRVLGNIFQTGGLVMSQVSNLLGLEPYLIQNWVKRGFLAPPQKKLYTRRQFCRLCIINMLKDTLRLERIAALISYVNGMLDDESDDTVGDDLLYDYYVDMCWFLEEDGAELSTVLDRVTADYKEPCNGGKERLKRVLEVMYYAHQAAVMKQRAELVLGSFNDNERMDSI